MIKSWLELFINNSATSHFVASDTQPENIIPLTFRFRLLLLFVEHTSAVKKRRRRKERASAWCSFVTSVTAPRQRVEN